MENLSIAASLRWHREHNNYSSKEVASVINVSPSIYSKIENGIRSITICEFKKIADLYDLTMDELYLIPCRKRISK